MKKLFAIVAVIGAFTFGSIQLAQAQDAPNFWRLLLSTLKRSF